MQRRSKVKNGPDIDERYCRQIALKEIGQAGQRRLASSTAIVIGVGGLGTHSAGLLARSGVGRLILVDGQTVELSNLHRQVLYEEDDLGQPKAAVAAERLSKANSRVDIIAIIEEVDKQSLDGLLDGVDVLVDGTDNMAVRQAINLCCVRKKMPWVFGGVAQTTGMSMTIVPGKTPCLSCVFPSDKGTGIITSRHSQGPSSRAILGTVPAMVGAIQATEALKLLLGRPPRKGLLSIDAWTGVSRVLDITFNKSCPVCGKAQPK